MNKTSTDFSNARQVRRLALELECTCKFVANFCTGNIIVYTSTKSTLNFANLIRG